MAKVGWPVVKADRGQHVPLPSDYFAVHGKQHASYMHIPVSYTHLRAHETVLDLVCRLLLEKKKKNDTKHTIRTRLTTH